MSSLVIVALPSKDDYVNRISTEKVPHMTLLFLGEDSTKVKNLDKIIGFVEHAANTTLTRFSLEEDRRDILGPDLADVLVFSKNNWSGFKVVEQFRSNLLKENNIRLAYNLATQHPEWIPHITLGYPETPAKPDERDYPGINYVSFDRIAVWFKDYEGVEFPLKRYYADMAVAMSDIVDERKEITEKILTHISEKPWSNYSKSDYTLEQWHRACLIHTHTGPPTAKSECKLPVKTPDGVLNRNGVHAAAAALAGARSPLKAPPDQKTKARSALRRYYSMMEEEPPDSLKQSAMDVVNDILSHFGVKGMRWGVRRDRPSSVTVTSKGKKLKTSGGYGRPAHSDAVRVSQIGQVGKKSGLKSLSNEELTAYSHRLNLEANVNRLNYANSSRSKRFVLTLLGQTGKNQASALANDVASTQVKKHLASRLAKAGALAAT